jgi:CBS domain-containing protein
MAKPKPNDARDARLTVSELMNADVTPCRPHDTVDSCARIMWERVCGCVPVVDDEGRPISIITDRDICMAAWIQGKPLSQIEVASAMSRRLLIVGAREPIAVAEAIMRRHFVRRLLVVDAEGRLVGVLSIDDLARHGDVGPILGREPLSSDVIAGTVAALGYASSRGS